MSRRLVVITAGLSQPSSTRLLADQLTDSVRARIGARGEGVEVTVIELRELAVDLATMMTSGGMPSERIRAARELVSSADGIIAVTPVFAGSYSGIFKMFVDSLDTDSLNGMPIVIAATAGTPRHSMMLDYAMRPLFGHLRAVVVPTGVFAATEDFGGGEGGDALTQRIGRAADELAALMVVDHAGVAGFGADPVATRRQRTSGNTIGAVTPFADLLKGHAG